MVRQASRKYGVDESLILAIMQTESSFNPYAVSRSDALGLMQVVQHTAGVKMCSARRGNPARRAAVSCSIRQHNSNSGTAIWRMLNNVYLGGIDNPTSRRYAVITAYNGGAGSVLRVFDDKIQAANIINTMTPGDVYQTLTTRHPSAESAVIFIK